MEFTNMIFKTKTPEKFNKVLKLLKRMGYDWSTTPSHDYAPTALRLCTTSAGVLYWEERGDRSITTPTHKYKEVKKAFKQSKGEF